MVRQVDAHWAWTAVVASWLGCAPVVADCLPIEAQRLLPAVGAAGEYFGGAIAVSGEVAIIGAQLDDDLGESAGAAYVFRFDGAQWVEEAKLTASDGESADEFGCAVAVSGAYALVGARGDDDFGVASGAAYVFHYDGASWSEQAKLTADDGASFDFFGWSVALDETTALVSAYRADVGLHSNVGAAYVFTREQGGWAQTQKLLASDGQASDLFAASLDLRGDVAVLGATGENSHGVSSGAVYVFRRIAGVFAQEQKLTASDANAGDVFGQAVATVGNIIVVSAFLDDDRGMDSGSVYVFTLSGGAWVQDDKLNAPDGAPRDRFGASLALISDSLLVGAPNRGGEVGAVYVFRNFAGDWVNQARLRASDAAPHAMLGAAVAGDGSRALVGALTDAMVADSGTVYAYRGLADCNANLSLDICDISTGASSDFNDNGVPDDCEDLCPTDLNHNGVTDLLDVSTFVANYGIVSGATPDQGDFDGDGDVDLGDMATIVNAYGEPCF